MGKRRVYDDDDGRTIADMSGVERPNLFTFRSPDVEKQAYAGEEQTQPASQPTLSKEQGRAYAWGALLAGLVIAGVFILAGAVFIALLLTVWK